MAACAENPNRFGFLFLEDQLRFFREIEALTPLADGWQWEEKAPTCPTCGKEATFTTWADVAEIWLVCDLCGAKTDEAEVAA